jgi:hypothetical protein
MPKIQRTVTIDERIMRAARAKAARTDRREADMIEAALRRDLGSSCSSEPGGVRTLTSMKL